MKKYKWIASSDDGCFEDESRQEFTSKRECYNDMRNAVLEQMKLKTEYTEAFNDCESIGYGVTFYQDMITHASYKSSVCTYEIKEINSMKTIELTEEQVKMIAHALRNEIRINLESSSRIAENFGFSDEVSKITANKITERNLCIKTLLNYIES